MTLFSTLLGACIGNFLKILLHRWKTGGSAFPSLSLFPFGRKSFSWNFPIRLENVFRWSFKGALGSRIGLRQAPFISTATAFLFGLSFLCFQNQWLLMLESFFLASFMVLFSTSDLQWRLLPDPFTNVFILLGLLFRSRAALPSSECFIAAGDCLLIGSLLFAAGQIFHQGLGGGDIKMASGLAVWLGLSKCFLALLVAFVTALIFVLPSLIKGKATLKTAMPLGPFLAAGALLIWFCPKCIDLTGIGL